MRRLSPIAALVLTGALASPAGARQSPHVRSEALLSIAGTGVPVRVHEPLFPDVPAVRQAVNDLAGGRGGAVAQLLAPLRDKVDPRLRPYLQYLLARGDMLRGRLTEAEAGFREVEASVPALAAHARAWRARVLLRAEREAEADALILTIPPSERAFTDLSFGLARRWMAAGRSAELPPIFDRIEPGLASGAERARLARLRADARLEVDRDRPAWLGRLADLWRQWPRSAAARESEDVLLAAFAQSDRHSPLTVEEVVDVAAARARSGKGATSLAQALGRRLGGQARGLDVLLRVEDAFPKRPDRLLVDVEKALKAMPLPAIEERLADLKIRLLRRLDRGLEALALYRRLGVEARVPGHRAEALLEGGALARRLYDTAEARWFYQEFLAHHADTYDEGRQRPLALWNLGWIAWREGALDEADRLFAKLAHEHPTAEDDSRRTYYERALYWRARVQQKSGRVGAARDTWRFLAERFPLSYYANLSEGWLWRTGGADAALTERSVPPESVARRLPRIDAVEAEAAPAAVLYRFGFEDDARQMLRHLFDLRQLGPQGSLLLSALYRQGGDDWRAHWVAWSAAPLDSAPEGAHRDRWLAAFPRPYDADVVHEAEEHEIAESLIYAVMRQESGFVASARSHAAAHGLMQVLLPTARVVAKKMLGEKAPSLKQVYSVRGNIHYGAAYLKHLLDRYDGHLACAVAGYNAGPGAVDRWLKRVGQLDADEFVEEIPYDETRGYTRRVLHNLAAYRHLYGETDAPDPRRLPMRLPGAAPEPEVSLLDVD